MRYVSATLVLVFAVLAMFFAGQAPTQQSRTLPAVAEIALADEETAAGDNTPAIAPASNDGLLAIQRIRVPNRLRVDLFAAEPQLANPVCFWIDEQGRFFVAETFRYHDGVTDIRRHMDWLEEDLASRSVADRVALLRRRLGEKFSTYAMHQDRVRLIEDTDGDGKADHSTVFADGFHEAETGIGAGLLARGGQVWYGCIPSLWLLRDTNNDGKADVRRVLHTGYGVHVGYIGHDLHGLRFGPDGKLYFSIGDRGFYVESEGRKLGYPDTGSVLRCNPDGSELEVFATGLRNPQELIFDKYGNLFTCDNNSDGGDQARWVYLVEGGDSGWRIGYQFLKSPEVRGPWNAEDLWEAHPANPAAYLLPPIDNIADGPSGLTYHPGTTQLPDRYRDHFFLADFRGGSGDSGIRSFAVKPKGASFELVDSQKFVWRVLATDVDFGPDGCLYLTDWVEGWDKPGKGRIYKIHDPRKSNDAQVREVRKLLAEGMAHRKSDALLQLMKHPDLRIRQEAQFALAERGSEAIESFQLVATRGANRLERLHAIWGLGQIARKNRDVLTGLFGLLEDSDSEVRAQLAKVLGESSAKTAVDRLAPLLRDPEPRVRFFAALSIGKLIHRRKQAPPTGVSALIVDMLRANADQDPYLRHAGVMALAWINDRQSLRISARSDSTSVRLAALLAFRRLEDPEVAQFLNDPEPRLVLEAARAINDVPIPAALPQLAAHLAGSDSAQDRLARLLSDPAAAELWPPILYRVLNASFRIGSAEQAANVARLAAQPAVPEEIRVESVRLLGEWAKPSGRDKVVGLWRPVEPRPARVAAEAFRSELKGIFNGPDALFQEATRLAATLRIREVGPFLVKTVTDGKQPADLRLEALKSLAVLDDDRLSEVVKRALDDRSPAIRTEARRILSRLNPDEAVPVLEQALEKGEQIERQGALAALGEISGPSPDAVLARWLDKLLVGKVPTEIQLDLLDASAKRQSPAIQQKLTRHEESRPADDPLAKYRELIAGGDPVAGRRIFFHKAEVSCLRCHKIQGEGGEVGPDLTGIAKRQTREYLLEALVAPNRQIAKGFETVVVETKQGLILTGILKAEDERELRLVTPEGKSLVIRKDQIEERLVGKSAMPTDVTKSLTRAEIRDLMEFLAGLKQQ